MVISNDVGNAYAETINVLPMTRHMKKPNLPCHTQIQPEQVSDAHQTLDASMILAEQITTISKTQLRNYAGKVDDRGFMEIIDRAVSQQLGLDENISISQHDHIINHTGGVKPNV